MQTLVFAVLLAAAAAATIPEQEPLSTNVTLPVYGFFNENNASTAAPAEQGDHQPATTSRPGNEQLTYADSQSPPVQPEETLVNHEEPLEQSTQQAHSQPEISSVDNVHTIQAAGENASNDTLQVQQFPRSPGELAGRPSQAIQATQAGQANRPPKGGGRHILTAPTELQHP
ncbi:acidic proline-rich protein HP43A-like isoform X2 [Scylla paramamosain]|uniref:acidic proline-rich protein HP43A-like isoform X2 n=1 Tax=Scylla paramamosain TaxID=85552 RepID=UPI003082D178